MSTAVATILSSAFRDGNFVSVGESATVEETAEALPRLNAYLSSLLGFEVGEQLREWPVPHDADAAPFPTLRPKLVAGTKSWANPPANVRLIVKATSASTVYFPPAPQDGARMAYADVGSSAVVTLDGNGRLIEGAATLTGDPKDTTPEPDVPATFHGRSWLYRADLGDWIRLKTLVDGDTVPLPPEFDDLLVTGLALRLAPRYGILQPDPLIVARHGDMLTRLKKRYKQTEPAPASQDNLIPLKEI